MALLAKIASRGLSGINGYAVDIEVDLANGLPSYETVGLPDAAVRESKERVRSAIKNSGFDYPLGRITVNLAPADMKKEGSLYDLPIATGILAASGQIPARLAERFLIVGELALNGDVRGITGIFPMLLDAAAKGVQYAIIPKENQAEASYIQSLNVFPAASLCDAAQIIRQEALPAPIRPETWSPLQEDHPDDFKNIRGQHGAKRAAEIAVAGGHNLLLIGTPGSGKTMLAKAIPSILPELTFQEASEITKIHSVAGTLKGRAGIVSARPFRSPHHSASAVAIIGGGQRAMPGEISLAHYGVLFLDEFPEFRRDVLEAMRQPLEDGVVSIARANARAEYPARFMLVAAMNPCPCGNLGSRMKPCHCTPSQISRYQNRLSAPLLDRIDIQVEMSEVSYLDLAAKTDAESSSQIRARVDRARKVQRDRYLGDGILFNAQLTNSLIKQYCALGAAANALLSKAYTAYRMSARAYTRILKVARTIADLDGQEAISEAQIAEALQYRGLDRKYFGGNS